MEAAAVEAAALLADTFVRVRLRFDAIVSSAGTGAAFSVSPT